MVDNNLTAYGPSEMSTALPPAVWEVLNCGLSAAAGVALLICIRYLASMFFAERRRYQLSLWSAFLNLGGYRLAVGFTIFLAGEWPRATWVWWARFATNHDIADVAWMGRWPWIVFPVAFGLLCILGKACIIRALIPMVWGRYAYLIVCGGAVVVVVITEVLGFRYGG